MNNSKPCKRCLALIKKYGIRKVYYSYDQELIYVKTRDITDPYLSSKYRNGPWSEWNNKKIHN